MLRTTIEAGVTMKHFAVVLLTLIVLCSSGCVDYGRSGMHKVMFVRPTVVGDAATEEEKLKQLVRDALAGKGFHEMSGKPHIWRKRGTTVQVYRDDAGELILKVRAFGSKRDVRVSEQTEEELLAILRAQSELSLSP